MNKVITYTISALIGVFALIFGADWFFERYDLKFQLPVQSPIIIEKKMNSPLPEKYDNIIRIPQGKLIVTPTPSVTELEKRTKAIEKRLKEYGSPVAHLAKTFAEESLKYPIYDQYPYLIPAMCIKETSCGKNVTFMNNLLNWGIKTDLVCHTPEYCIERAVSGIGKRTSFYEDFRKTGDLKLLLVRYAPPSENNTDQYYNDLMAEMKRFEVQEN